MGGVGQGRFGGLAVADFPVKGQVARYIAMQLRSLRVHGVGAVDHHRQVFIVNGHRLGGVAGLVAGLRHDQGYGLAHIAYGPTGQNRSLTDFHFAAVNRMDHPTAGHIRKPGQIIGGEDAHDAGHGLGGRCAQTDDPGMGIGRADKGGIGLARQDHIINKPPLALDETRVLEATQRAAEMFAGRRRVHGRAAIARAPALIARTMFW